MSVLNKVANLRLTFQLVSMFVIGIILVLVGGLSDQIHALLTVFFDMDPKSGLAEFAAGKLGDAKGLGIITIISGVSIYFAASGIESWYANNVEPIFQSHTDRLSEELRKSSVVTNDLLSAKVLDHVIKASTASAIKSRLADIHAQAYGTHCAENGSLFRAVENKIGGYFDRNSAHRSDSSQTVTIVDFGDGKIQWHEEVSYQLRAIGLDKTRNDDEAKIEHRLRARSESIVKDLSFSGDDMNFEYVLKVDGKTIIDTKTDLKLVDGKVEVRKGVEDLKVIRTGEFFSIRLERVIELTKPSTLVEVNETSVILDDFLISRRKDPTRGSNISIHLPEGWSFETYLFGEQSDWTVHNRAGNTLSATTRDWILPGIAFFVNWKKDD